MGKNTGFTAGAITIVLAAALAVPAAGSSHQGGDGALARTCSSRDDFIYRKVVKEGKPTSLRSDLVEGPGSVEVSKGRQATSTLGMTQTGGDSGGIGLDFKVFKAEWNESHSRSYDISNSITKTLTETVSYHVPRHRTGQIVVKRSKLFIKVIRLHSNPRCHTIRSHYLVKAPLKHAPLLFTRKLYRQH
jgi:hypothetical protein